MGKDDQDQNDKCLETGIKIWSQELLMIFLIFKSYNKCNFFK